MAQSHDEPTAPEPLGTVTLPEGTILDAAARVEQWLHVLEDQHPIAGVSIQADDLRRLVDHARGF